MSTMPSSFKPLDFTHRRGGRTSQTPMSVEEIQRAIEAVADQPLALATTLPAQAYTSEAFFDWEASHLLRQEWHAVAHISQIPQPGDFLNFDLLGEPLIIVQGKDGEVRVLSRVCPHRAMDIMPAGFGHEGHGMAEVRPGEPHCGHTRLFLCPYHAWTFELDGQLKACPEMHQAEGFSRQEFFLKPFRSEVWHGFIFVNLDGSAPPLAEGLGEMSADIAPWKIGEMKLVIARDWDCEFNWKVLVENFMESYHHLGIHSKTLQPTMPARDTWTEQERRHYIRAHLPYKPSVLENLRQAEERGEAPHGFPFIEGLSETQKSEWGLYLISPTFLLATTPDRVIWYRLQPLGPDRMKLTTTTLVSPAAVSRIDFEVTLAQATKMLCTFHLEDMEVCTAVQRGLYSSGWRAGRLSHLEMPVWLLQRYLAARIRGVWPTDDRTPAASQRP